MKLMDICVTLASGGGRSAVMFYAYDVIPHLVEWHWQVSANF
jgi:hypothetical protein